MTVYITNQWKGYGKQNYYWNEYRVEENRVVKYKCHKYRFFDGEESVWKQEEHVEESWEFGNPNIPDWLMQYI